MNSWEQTNAVTNINLVIALPVLSGKMVSVRPKALFSVNVPAMQRTVKSAIFSIATELVREIKNPARHLSVWLFMSVLIENVDKLRLWRILSLLQEGGLRNMLIFPELKTI